MSNHENTQPNDLLAPELRAQPSPSTAQDKSVLADEEASRSYKPIEPSLFGLLDPDPIMTIRAISDHRERAVRIKDSPQLDYDHPEWVALIRSVDVPEAGQLGAELQRGIGSTHRWEKEIEAMKAERKRQKLWINKYKRELAGFKKLNLDRKKEGRRPVSRARYCAGSYL